MVADYGGNRKSEIANRKLKCQGDHGGCRANYRCCLPALAGFVSPHSMGPGPMNVRQHEGGFKEKSNLAVGYFFSGSPGFTTDTTYASGLKYFCATALT